MKNCDIFPLEYKTAVLLVTPFSPAITKDEACEGYEVKLPEAFEEADIIVTFAEREGITTVLN
uniref:Uncharacterized protein n=1 Tax=Geoglobus ahangari TaxID=113653 RepID=A0A7C4S7Q3_9EURY